MKESYEALSLKFEGVVNDAVVDLCDAIEHMKECFGKVAAYAQAIANNAQPERAPSIYHSTFEKVKDKARALVCSNVFGDGNLNKLAETATDLGRTSGKDPHECIVADVKSLKNQSPNNTAPKDLAEWYRDHQKDCGELIEKLQHRG